MTLTQVAQKYRVSEAFLNSKEDALIVVYKSVGELIGELNQGKIDENRKQSIIEKLERLGMFCKDVKDSGI